MPGPDVLSRLAALSPYAALDGPRQAAADGWPLSHPGPMVEHTAHLLGTANRQVAASIAFQTVTRRLAAAVVLANGVVGCSLSTPFDELRWRPAEPVLGLGLTELMPGPPLPWRECLERLVADAYDPWLTRVRADVRIGERLLWGNAAAALVGAARLLLHVAAPAPDQTAELLGEIHAALPVRGLVDTRLVDDWITFRRRTCCLVFLAKDGQLCQTCSLRPVRDACSSPA